MSFVPRLFLLLPSPISKQALRVKPLFALYRDFLLRYLGPFKWQVALLALSLLGNTATSVYAPRVLSAFIDGTLQNLDFAALAPLAAVFLLAGLGRHLTQALTAYVSENVAWSATNRLRTDLLTHAVSLDMTFFAHHPPGAMLERIDGDTNQLAHFFSQFSLRFLRSALLLLGIALVLAFEDWRLCLALLLFILAVSVLLVRLRNFGVPYNERLRAAAADLYGLAEERLSSLEDIKALGGVIYTLQQMAGFIEKQIYHGKRAFSLGNLMWPSTLAITGAGAGMMLAWGGILALRGDMTLGTVYLLFAYMNLMLWPLEDLSHQMEELQKAGGNLIRIQELLTQRSALKDGTRRALGAAPVRIRFEDVTFRYAAGGVAALKRLSFDLEPGQTLGIAGRTGSGKTTVARLLARLYDPDSGAVTLNGTDLREFALDALRRQIGVITQDVQFFRGTLRENLSMFDDAVEDQRIEAALTRLNLRSWLETQPQGLDTVVSGAQLALSAGEAQRLALARIFLRDPEIVILDEAVARLDPATEKEMEALLWELMQGRTSVVIAHKMSSIARVDHILILDRGEKQEYGPRQRLLDDPASRLNRLIALGWEKEEPTL